MMESGKYSIFEMKSEEDNTITLRILTGVDVKNIKPF